MVVGRFICHFSFYNLTVMQCYPLTMQIFYEDVNCTYKAHVLFLKLKVS